MHSDFNISSGLEKPKSRHLSLNDVRITAANNEKSATIFPRCTSLQWLTDEEKALVLKRSKTDLGDYSPQESNGAFENALRLFNALRLNNNEEDAELERIEKEWQGKYDNDERERCSFELDEKLENKWGKSEHEENEEESDYHERSWCQCSKDNINYNVNTQARVMARKNNATRRIKNVMSTLNEEVLAETKCERCHLEIRDETRKKEKIIELWMQFFG